jgi:methionyl-tRNA formyltransferase
LKIKIGYFADGPWSHNAFKKLISDKDIDISFICVRWNTKDVTLKKYCRKYKISYLRHPDVNSFEFIELVKNFNCDIFISMSFDQIFKNEIINLPSLKVINCHAGKLPFYRGRNILNWALINDEKEFGITVHYVDEGIDTGDIILQRCFLITDEYNYSNLLNIAYEECANVLYDAILLIKSGGFIPITQASIDLVGSYYSKRKLGDELINWKQSSRDIFNFVRAICPPGPSARAWIKNVEMKINKVEEISNAPYRYSSPGLILHKDKTGFLVKTIDSFVKVIDYEVELDFIVGDQFDV